MSTLRIGAACTERVFQLSPVVLSVTVSPVSPTLQNHQYHHHHHHYHWLHRLQRPTEQPTRHLHHVSTRHWPHTPPRWIMQQQIGDRARRPHTTTTTTRPLHTSIGTTSSRWGHLTSVEDAQKFLASMPVPQRQCLEQAVLEAREKAEQEKDGTPPTWRQLKLCELASLAEKDSLGDKKGAL